jgi:hypothetical protein
MVACSWASVCCARGIVGSGAVAGEADTAAAPGAAEDRGVEAGGVVGATPLVKPAEHCSA